MEPRNCSSSISEAFVGVFKPMGYLKRQYFWMGETSTGASPPDFVLLCELPPRCRKPIWINVEKSAVQTFYTFKKHAKMLRRRWSIYRWSFRSSLLLFGFLFLLNFHIFFLNERYEGVAAPLKFLGSGTETNIKSYTSKPQISCTNRNQVTMPSYVKMPNATLATKIIKFSGVWISLSHTYKHFPLRFYSNLQKVHLHRPFEYKKSTIGTE